MNRKIHVGFTGSSSAITIAQMISLRGLLTALRATRELIGHHGCCIVADEVFHNICDANNLGIPIVCHPPIDRKKMADIDLDARSVEARRPKKYLDRNYDIAVESDLLICVPHAQETLRSGEWATVRYARKLRRRVFIIWHDGRILDDSRDIPVTIEEVLGIIGEPQ